MHKTNMSFQEETPYTCNTKHNHQPLMPGRAKDAELQPKQLMLEILRDMRDQADEDLLREEEEAEIQRVATLNSGFNSEDAYPYRPSMQYQFMRRDVVNAVVGSKLNISHVVGRTDSIDGGKHFKSD